MKELEELHNQFYGSIEEWDRAKALPKSKENSLIEIIAYKKYQFLSDEILKFNLIPLPPSKETKIRLIEKDYIND